MESQKLYKLDNTGKTRVWWAETGGERYRLHSGIIDGAITKSEWTICDGKNIGRSNETSPKAQCLLEVEALYTKKLKKGYAKTQADTAKAKSNLISPMLAHKWQEHESKIRYPVYAQPKLDGIRCIVTSSGALTRKNEPIKTVPHIVHKLVELCENYEVMFDGELYNHDLKDDFNKIASLVRRQKIDDKHARDVRDIVEYHIYDIITEDDSMTFLERLKLLRNIFDNTNFPPYIIRVPTIKCGNRGILDDYYGELLQDGYEGQMIRLNEIYHRKRTNALLKRKEFMDEEFEIIGVLEGKGNRAGMVGALAFKTKEGRQFTAALMGTDAYRTRVWEDKDSYIGVDATVKYFHKTPDGSPRFPVVKSIDEGK